MLNQSFKKNQNLSVKWFQVILILNWGIQIPREDNKNNNGNEDITIFCRDYNRHTLNSPITKNKEIYHTIFDLVVFRECLAGVLKSKL